MASINLCWVDVEDRQAEGSVDGEWCRAGGVGERGAGVELDAGVCVALHDRAGVCGWRYHRPCRTPVLSVACDFLQLAPTLHRTPAASAGRLAAAWPAAFDPAG